MYVARRGAQAVIAVFVAAFCIPSALSQSAQFFNLETRSLRVSSFAYPARPCFAHANLSLGAKPDDTSNAGDVPSRCDHALSGAAVPIAPRASVSASIADSPVGSDFVRDDLHGMGKQGRAILRAREKVLEILQTENACSDWYRTKDPDPAATFRTLSFSLDRRAEAYVLESPDSGGMQVIHNPYVASISQANGRFAAISLNLNGAFFFPMANVVEDRGEGGPIIFRGVRPMQVGPYSGGTSRAQVATLLHELGHAINLLPYDADDIGGKSRENTETVLRFCRPQVESKDVPHTFLASR